MIDLIFTYIVFGILCHLFREKFYNLITPINENILKLFKFIIFDILFWPIPLLKFLKYRSSQCSKRI